MIFEIEPVTNTAATMQRARRVLSESNQPHVKSAKLLYLISYYFEPCQSYRHPEPIIPLIPTPHLTATKTS